MKNEKKYIKDKNKRLSVKENTDIMPRKRRRTTRTARKRRKSRWIW